MQTAYRTIEIVTIATITLTVGLVAGGQLARADAARPLVDCRAPRQAVEAATVLPPVPPGP